MNPLVLDSKKRYRELCLKEKSIPIYSRDWWLDTVCGEENWDVVLVENDSIIIGAMPYYKKLKFSKLILSQPPLTYALGPWIRKFDAKYTGILAYQKDVMEMIIQQLPKFDHFLQNWAPSITNWQPFFWKGFQQTTLYTYILPDISDEELLFLDFENKIRGDIRKATNRFNIKIRHDLGVDELLILQKKTYERQEKTFPYPDALLKKIDNACQEHNCKKIFIAEDPQGQHHAGVYTIWDENTTYAFIMGGDPNLRSSGATSLCMWEAVRYASEITQQFNFTGSMIEPIERFLRAFGAIQTPYFQISKTPSKLLKIGKILRDLKNGQF